MGYIIFIIAILCIAMSAKEIVKTKLEVAIPISIISMILIVYIFAIFNFLKIGGIIIVFILVLSLIYNLIILIKKIKEKVIIKYVREEILTPGVCIFALLYVVNVLLNKGRLLSSWDEFSHWGLVVKNMYEFNMLGTNPETNVLFRGYPPFVAIFEWLCLFIRNAYNEGTMIVAYNLLYISLIIPVFKNVKWQMRDIKVYTIYLLLILMIPTMMYYDFYTIIYIDPILSAMFAYILYIYYSDTSKKEKSISIILGVISLPLIKLSGTGLAIIAIFIIAVDMLIKYIKNKQKNKLKEIIIMILILIVAVLVGKFSWDVHMNFLKTEDAWNTSKVTVENITKVITGNGDEYQYTTINNFFNKFYSEKMTFGNKTLTTLNTILLWIIYSIFIYGLICKQEKNFSKSYRILVGMILLGFVVYMLTLLVLYLFTYTEYEAVRLASYMRYVYTYILAMFLLNSYILLDYAKNNYKTAVIAAIAIILLFNPAATNGRILINNSEEVEKTKTMRQEYEDIGKYKKILKQSDKVYYISCGSKGLDAHISRFNLVPYTLSYMNISLGWSLGEKRNAEDIWSVNLSLEQIEELLTTDEYTYMYIYYADDIFKKQYGKLFADKIENKTMYKIYNENKTVYLEKVKV